MANWTTEWTTHPDYPGWRKRRLVDPKSGMQAMLQTFWERIPGSDPTLPGPPGSERGGNPFLPPSWKRPDFGKFPKLPPGKPYRPPSGTHEMPGIPDRSTRPPGERVEPDWWKKPFPFFPKWKDKGIKPMPMPPRTRPGIWDKFPRRKFDGNEKDFLQLLKDAQVGSAMPKYHSGQRKNIRDLSTEMATDPLSYVSDNVRGPQLGGVPEDDRKFVDTMHNIQNAYFTGADFGYEEGWAERLGATQEQIDMFMAVPEEAIRHAMENPTDAVLQQFEEYYGFPLNVNDPDMQKYFGDRKKKR